MITSRPLRVKWGTGDPHLLHTEVAKLWAVGRSYRFILSSPLIQRKASGLTKAFAA